MENKIEIPQYSLKKILLIWAAAAIPIGILGWVVAPAAAQNPLKPGFERLAILTIGLAWQFILVIILLYLETGSLRWSTVCQRLWLNNPRSSKTGRSLARLWWWIVPILIVTALYQMKISKIISHFWITMLPFFTEPSGFAFMNAIDTPEAKAQMVGAWNIFALFLISALFNTFLGEEMLFRGFLLPRMKGVFGKWDWVMNGVLFGLYHIHQPWSILSSSIRGAFLFALPTRYFQSSWFGIIAHSGQSIFIGFLLLGLVLGLA